MKHFIQRFCFIAFLFCNIFTASLYAQDIYAGTDASIIPERTIEDKQPDFDPVVPGCLVTNVGNTDLAFNSFAVNIQHTYSYTTVSYQYKAVIKYEVQLMDSQSNNIGLPVIILPPSQTSLSQYYVIIPYTFTGLQASTAYKYKIRQFCDLSPAPNEWGEYTVNDVLTLDPNNCNIFNSIDMYHTGYALYAHLKNVSAGINFHVKVSDMNGLVIYNNSYTSTSASVWYYGNYMYLDDFSNLEPCKQYIVSASVDNCSVGISSIVNTPCCNAMDAAVIEDRAPTSITAKWEINLNNVVGSYLSVFRVTLQQLQIDGTYMDMETHQEYYSYDPTVPLSYTFNNLEPDGQYRVKVTPVCDVCYAEKVAQVNDINTVVNNSNGILTCDLIGPSVYAYEGCTAAADVAITSIQSNALTVSFNHTPSLNHKKYYVELIEKATGALLDSEWSQLGAGVTWTYTKTFQGLKNNTQYAIKVKTYCGNGTAFTPSNKHSFISTKEAKTLQNLCGAATDFSATRVGASSMEITWKNPEAKLKRFVVQIHKDGYMVSSKEILSDGKANQVLNCLFDGLEANTEYVIKINAQCCMGATAGVCNAWSEGEGINFTAKTAVDEPASCKDQPTVFHLVANGNSVTVTWEAVTPEPDNGGRRFLIDYGQKDIFVLDNATKNTIENLETGKNYTFKIREVFDGYGSVFTSGCAVQNMDIGLQENPCPPSFGARVQCPGIGSMMLHFEGTLPKDSRLVVKYRDASQAIVTALGIKPTAYCGKMDPCDVPISTAATVELNKNAFPSIEAVLDKDNNYILEGLNACAIYEIETELFIKLANGSEVACKKTVFPTYFHTLAGSNTQGVNPITSTTSVDGFNDVNKNGIDDECEKFSAPTQNPPSTNLGNILCGGNLPFADTDPGVAYSTGKVGSIFYINGFPLEVTEIKTHTGNVYTGQGVIALPISDDKLVVAFSSIAVNELKDGTLKVVAGTATGVNDADLVVPGGAVKTSRPKISDIIKAIDADNLKATEGFCDEPEPEKIDNTGLKNGFDKDGNYAMKPPYEGYSNGAPTDSKYNPQGFDANGMSHNNTKYNDCGYDKDGNCDPARKIACDPKLCAAPYYWKVNALTTTYGGQLFEQEKDKLKAEVIKILEDQRDNKWKKDIVPLATASKVIRDKMVADQVALAYDKPLVFGEKDKWINLGMHKFFKKAPIPFAINMSRLPKHEELEALHKDLYYADVNEYKVQLYIDLINELLKDKPLDAYIVSLGQRIKTTSNDEAEKMKKDRVLFLKWLTEQVIKKTDYDYSIKMSTAFVEPLNDEQAAYAVSSAKALIKNASPYINTDNVNIAALDNNVFDDIQRMKANEPEKYAAWQEQNLQFDFKQGFDKVGGISRAFVLRAINQQRLIDQYLAGEDNMMTPTTSVGQPIIKGAPTASGQNDPEKVIYYDQFRFDAKAGAKVNIYCIVNTGKKEFVVQAIDAPLSFKGFDTPVRLGLGTDFTFPISNIARFTLKGVKEKPEPTPQSICADAQTGGDQGTFVEVDCKGFKRINVDIKIEFCDKYITPLDEKMNNITSGMVSGYFKASATSFHDIVINCIDISPFVLTKHPDFKFKITGLVLDFSSERTPNTVKFPNNYITTFASTVSSTGGTAPPVLTPTPAWKGFYAKEIKVVLPEKFNGSNGDPRTVYAKDFIIDEGGITGIVGATNIFDMNGGSTIGGWRFSMTDLNLTFVRNRPVGAGFKGKVHLPILKKDEDWLYEAAILPDGDYQFSVKPETKSTVDLWVAEVAFDKTSFVQIQKVGDKDLVATAVLNGKIDFAGNKNSTIDMKDISFKGLSISSEKSNPIVNPGTWGAPSVDVHVKGFTFYLGNIALKRGEAKDGYIESLLNFDMKLSLAKDDGTKTTTPPVSGGTNTTNTQSQKLDIAAGGSFTLVGKIVSTNNEQEWKYDRLKINGLSLKCETSTFKLDGQIRFFEGSKDYGEGFFGKVEFYITKPKIGAFAMAIFGKMPTNDLEKYPQGFYKYFIVDAMVNVPIPAGPITFTGIGGGVSWHMSRVEPTSTTFTNAPLDLTVPKTVSGVTYQPNKEFGLGIRLMTTLELASTPRSFNGGAVLEIMFNAEGGLSYIALQGVAHFMADPDPTAAFKLNTNNIKDGIHADLKMKMDIEKAEFSANMEAYIYVEGGTVVGCSGGCDTKKLGSMEIFFGTGVWFINIGRTNPDFKNRVSLGMGIANTNVKIVASAYLNIGNKLPPMAPLPSWATKLVGNGLNIKDESSRASGKGFAFGASLTTSFGGEQQLFGKIAVYGQVTLDAGFDIMMQDYGNTRCVNNANRQIGINGWYANGQIYALIAGEVGVKYNDTKFPLLDCGVAAVLQAKGPNPFWAKGAVSVRYKILFGLYKGEANFVTEIGKKCEVAGQSGGTLNLGTKIISDITPENDVNDVNLNTHPQVNFNFPVNEQFLFTPISGEPYPVKAVVKSITVSRHGIPVQATKYEIRYKNANTTAKIVFKEMLEVSTDYTVKTEVFAVLTHPITKKEILIPGSEEMKSVKFRTQAKLDEIPKGNIGASYPKDGMYNYYRNEDKENNGFIILKQGQGYLLNTLPDGYSESIVTIYKRSGSGGRGEGDKVVSSVPFSYNDGAKKISFTMPNEKLEKETCYKMLFVQKHDNDSKQDKVLLTFYFRTSKYGTFYDKMNASQITSTKVSGTFAYNISVDGGGEPFDDREMQSQDGRLPLIVASDHINETNWYKDFAYPKLYEPYPKQIRRNAIKDKIGAQEINIDFSNDHEYNPTPVRADDAMLKFTRIYDSRILAVDEEMYVKNNWKNIIPGQQGVKFTFYDQTLNAIKEINPQFSDANVLLGQYCTALVNNSGCKKEPCKQKVYHDYYDPNNREWIIFKTPPSKTSLTFYYVLPKGMYVDPESNEASEAINGGRKDGSTWKQQFINSSKPTSIVDREVDTN